MSQPIKGSHKNTKAKKLKPKTKFDFIQRSIERSKKPHPKFGVSKLERRFAEEFLDKLGVNYIYQFEVKEIGRTYDFLIKDEHIIIEVDGDFWHGYGLQFEQKNSMQKRNEQVDKLKDKWAYANGYIILRIWEHDINNNPDKVMKLLKEKFHNTKLIKEHKRK